MAEKNALLGLHDEDQRKMFNTLLSKSGYNVTLADSVDAMLGEMGLSRDSHPDAEPSRTYQLYLMDSNLGLRSNPSIEPASVIYNHVKKYVERGEVKFLTISGRIEALEAAERAGIPTISKGESESYFRFLDSL